MSILIKGMEMPKRCLECQFSGFGGLYNERVVCMFTGSNAYMNSVQYLDKCPLVAVPPHGRLIDADVLRNLCDDPYWCVWLSEIDDAPTIIEAEEET